MSEKLKHKVLANFLKSSHLTGGQLEIKCGVSRTAIWNAINALRKDGFSIESKDRRGYIFWGDNDILSEEMIKQCLTTQTLAQNLRVLQSTDSTNSYIKREMPLIPTSAVVAAQQTMGLGRKGRTFYSPKGGIYLSVCLKPQIPPQELQFLTVCAAVSVCRALEHVCGFKADIKWVNDIFYGGKKLCGISTDASFSAEILGVNYVVMGIGINVECVAQEVQDIATSIGEITQKSGFKNRLVAALFNELEATTEHFYTHGKKDILKAYKERLFIIGSTVTVSEFNTTYKAKVLDLDQRAGLVVALEDGTIKTLSAAEVSLQV